MKEEPNKEKRYYCNDRFSVHSIAYSSGREISALVISNEKGQTVYELKAKVDAGSRKEEGQPKSKKESIRQGQEAKKEGIFREQMASLQAELKRTGVAMEVVQERYRFTSPEGMNEKTYKRVMEALSKTKAA